ncbi:radical SAM/SPASM domain-containing protein [Patescibacteria group bacterium]
MNKFINRFKLLSDYIQKNPESSGYPLELVIEATNHCNLNCIMCLRQNMKRKIGYMSMKLYKKIVNETANYLELLYLHGEGEPLFHPKIFEMVKYAKQKGLSVGISTNATILTKEKSKKLLESGLDYLIIALDATTAKTYKKVRGGNNFNQVKKNVRDYLRLKNKASHSPFTVIQFVKMAENEKEEKKFRSMWQNSGAEVVRVKPVIDLLRESQEKGKLPHRPCFYIWRQLNFISWDGRLVTACCMDAEGDYPLGNVNQRTIAEIWNGKPMVALREAHTSGRWRKMPFCQNCTFPQPSLPGRVGAMILPGDLVKKILPFLEKITLGNFQVYD